jgi:hypothetical protein
MPVGPGAQEVHRAQDTVASILTWEPTVSHVVLVDDSPEARRLVIPGSIPLAHPLAGVRAHRADRVGAATLAGFRWVATETNAEFVMKIDSDALVIAPFADKVRRALADPGIGLIGSYERGYDGGRRSFEHWRWPVRLAALRSRPVRRIVRDARRSGYVWGEHALGCTVAIPRRALDVMALHEPTMFVGTRLFDDPILGLLVRSAGFRLADHQGAFGVSWRGLPDTPERLLQAGCAIVHSVKNDPNLSETEIREFFRSRRG